MCWLEQNKTKSKWSIYIHMLNASGDELQPWMIKYPTFSFFFNNHNYQPGDSSPASSKTMRELRCSRWTVQYQRTWCHTSPTWEKAQKQILFIRKAVSGAHLPGISDIGCAELKEDSETTPVHGTACFPSGKRFKRIHYPLTRIQSSFFTLAVRLFEPPPAHHLPNLSSYFGWVQFVICNICSKGKLCLGFKNVFLNTHKPLFYFTFTAEMPLGLIVMDIMSNYRVPWSWQQWC